MTVDGAGTAGVAYVISDVLTPVASGTEVPTQPSLSAPRPNPTTTGLARLDLALDTPQAVRATLHDALGRTVAVLYEGAAAGTVPLAVDAAGLAPGVYTVRVAGATVSAVRRLTVAR